GLAATGEPLYADILRQIIGYEEPGLIRYKAPMYRRSGLETLARRLPAGFDRAHLAASAQLVLEEVGSAFVRYWLKKSGMDHLALAGGVCATVEFNQRLHELTEVRRIFIRPAMEEGGLCVGSALVARAREGGFYPPRMIRGLPAVYLGMGYSDGELAGA